MKLRLLVLLLVVQIYPTVIPAKQGLISNAPVALKLPRTYRTSQLASEMTDTDIIQQVLEGVFSENKMDGPYMIKYCFDQKIAHATVVFLGDALARAAKGSAKDLIQLIS